MVLSVARWLESPNLYPKYFWTSFIALIVLGDLSRKSDGLGTPVRSHCAMNIHSGLKIASVARQLIAKMSALNELGCRKACCQTETCSGYNWDMDHFSCSMFNCMASEPKCLVGSKSDGRMGLIEGAFSNTENLRDGDPLLPMLPSYMKKSPIEMSPIGSSKNAALTSVRNLMMINRQKESFRRGAEMVSPGAKLHALDEVRPDNLHNQIVRKESFPNATSTQVKHRKQMSHIRANSSQTNLVSSPTESRHVHTTKTSLIVALCFGMTFLIVVIIVVSRRWFESTTSFRTGYQRVEFLMNGNLSR